MATTQQKKFIDLLEEIFQFDQADLDFGIYRIMNQKREEVTNFLNNELLPQVKKAFDKYRNADVEAVKQQMEELEQKLNEMGVAKDSSVKYLTLKERINKDVDIMALENEVFSDLTNFFRRYYYEGDFLSLRRYKKYIYAIPYEGEEVKLHWANADQYYVKTSEYFRSYTFNLPSGKAVHFNLIEANTERNNNKAQEGKERRFILFEEEPIKEEDEELYIQFEYRPPEGKQNQKQLNENALEYLFSLTEYNDWLRELKKLAPTEKNKKRTILEKYLNDYTSRNTFDYFIHKELGKFLRRELDFFIKNEVMHLDDVDTENERGFEQYLSKVKVIKSIGNKIISFLEQIEDFQKRLWLKKKFVVETNYCITIDRIPKEFYKEIIENKDQVDEWIKLFNIDEIESFTNPVTTEFLKENQNLILDTKFFDTKFKENLLSNFDDIDHDTNGLLIHSENFQALNLIQEKYSNKIKCVYIDPPYNSPSSEILYKNNYKHSTWLTLMENRLNLSKYLSTRDGSTVVAIDKYEHNGLFALLSQLHPNSDIASVSIEHNKKGTQGDHFSYSNEYAIFTMPNELKSLNRVEIPEDEWEFSNLRNWGGESLREDAANCFYPVYVKDNEIIGFGEVSEDDFHPSSSNLISKDGVIEIYPIDDEGIERKWRYARQTVEDIKKYLKVDKSRKGNLQVKLAKATEQYKTMWYSSKYNAGDYGTKVLSALGLGKNFDYPKSIYTVRDCIFAVSDKNDIVLDYFAGSGTTGHATINLNREDGGDRKYILVEMGEYFNTVTKPRVQKVIYSEDWKDGKPVSRRGSSHIFKYIELETYEDTLNNIKFNRTPEQQAAMEEIMSTDAREDYLLSYMLDVEAEGSPSLLTIEAFNNPFEYKMKIMEGAEIKSKKIDLVETFNYLIGIHVKTIDMINGVKVITGVLRNGEEVLILWRNIDEVPNEQLEDFFKKQGYSTRDTEFDRIYVNGDNHLENLKLAVDRWKVVLIEEEFKRLMFDV
ncbi:site-specific DNA-methyltransferase [Bhargavaea cecembensis]|uniref:site-specific DNA-methyltransferase n=1 Tax=Bhargavaea cecembensis TaxID=394098 RepID=UPI000694768C|nr:DNA methyltransferase [Bhargavaea cecembensis]